MMVEGKSHAELLAALHATAFTAAERWSAAAMAALLDMPGCFGCLHGPDGAPVGMALVRVAADEAELLTIAVAPASRGAGAGAALLEQAMAEAVRRRACRMFLEVAPTNQAACALYRRHGFAQVGRRFDYYADGSDALVLARVLPGGTPGDKARGDKTRDDSAQGGGVQETATGGPHDPDRVDAALAVSACVSPPA